MRILVKYYNDHRLPEIPAKKDGDDKYESILAAFLESYSSFNRKVG